MTSQKRFMSPLALVLTLSGVFFVIFLVVSGVFFLSKSSGGLNLSKRGGNSLFSGGSVGVLEINGVIMDSKKVLKRLERFEEDSEIRAVVIRLNSPGGAVAPSQEIYEAIHRSKKPMIASMGSVAASGGYYIACGTQKIYANAGTITGSIGVIMEFLNLSKLYDWAKVQRYSIKTGRYKDAGAEYRDMNPDERALLQGMVDDVLSQFKQAVSEGRKLPMEKVTAIADGRIFSGSQAKQAKLVDEIGTLKDAIDEAARLGNIKGKPTLVYPEKSNRKWWEMLMDDGSKEESAEAEATAMTKRGLLAKILGELLGSGESGSAEQALTGMAPGVYWLWKGAR